MPDWHTEMERELIDEFGGTHTKSYGPDGTLGGDPVEVRLAKKEDRFRLNRDTHEELVANDGSYIFDKLGDGIPPREVEADRVDDLLGRGSWHSDRGYEHRFLGVDDIF
jgi:hypothetical protein